LKFKENIQGYLRIKFKDQVYRQIPMLNLML